MNELALKLEHLEKFYNEKFKTTELAITVALQANNKRLDGMNEFRETLSDQANRMMTRVEALAVIQQVQDKSLAEIKPLHEKIAEIQKPNYTLYTGLASALVGICAGVWLIIGLKIDVANSPYITKLEAVNTQLNILQSHNITQDGQIYALSVEQASITSEFKKTEAEFCSSDTVRNLMHANDLRLFSILWDKSNLGHFPTDNAYYPQICDKTEKILH